MKLNNGPPTPTDYTRYGILEVGLTTAALTVPQGIPSTLLTDPQGYINFSFLKIKYNLFLKNIYTIFTNYYHI